MRIFLDTSALVKLYVLEAGSDVVRNRVASADDIVVAILAEPEAVSAMNRRRREGLLTDLQYQHVKAELIADLQTFDLVELDRRVLEEATRLLETFPLRAMDGLQLACAAISGVDLVVSSDVPQLGAARALGIAVLDPTQRASG